MEVGGQPPISPPWSSPCVMWSAIMYSSIVIPCPMISFSCTVEAVIIRWGGNFSLRELWTENFVIIKFWLGLPVAASNNLYKYHHMILTDCVVLQLATEIKENYLKELCHHISIFLVTEAGWGSPISNQVHGRCGFVALQSRHDTFPCLAGRVSPAPTIRHALWH